MATQSNDDTPASKDTMTQADIESDAMRDMTPNQYYSKPGATMPTYYQAWQRCRMISRGASPNILHGYGLMGRTLQDLIGGSGLRRRNRKRCMLIDGWRIVQSDPQISEKIQGISSADWKEFFSGYVGSSEVQGKIVDWNSINPDQEIRKKADGPIRQTYNVIDPSGITNAPLAPDEGALIIAFRRPSKYSLGIFTKLNFRRYNEIQGDLDPLSENSYDNISKFFEISNSDKKSIYELHMIRVKIGKYVLDSVLPWQDEHYSGLGDNCLGAPIVEIRSGTLTYGGDFIPAQGVPVNNGSKFKGLVWTNHLADAQAAIASKYPSLAPKLEPAIWKNNVTYKCKEVYFDHFYIPGTEESLLQN